MSCVRGKTWKTCARVTVKYTVCPKSFITTATFWPLYMVTLFTSHFNFDFYFNYLNFRLSISIIIIASSNITSVLMNTQAVIIILCNSFFAS